MSLSRKILLIAGLALIGLGGLIYAALANILSQNGQDEAGVSYLTVSVVVAGGGFFLVTLLLMNQLVLARLARLNAAISGMSASGDLSKRLEIDGRDELAGLALEINNMLGSLQASQQAAQRARAPLGAQDSSQLSDYPALVTLPAAASLGENGRAEGNAEPALSDSGKPFADIFRARPSVVSLRISRTPLSAHWNQVSF